MFNNLRLIATTSTAAALALFVAGVTQVTGTPSGETTVVGIEHVLLGCLSAALVLLIPVVLHLGLIAGRRETGAITAVGQGVLALLVLISNGRGSVDLPAVAGLSNLAIFGGLIVLAIAVRRKLEFRSGSPPGCH
ncbi:MAG: hypothetical protein M3481_09505 [Actinomycetota bacterium]|jgi:hypothetical protein|nr:hypothetical protein [Actinomycetota bacterium]